VIASSAYNVAFNTWSMITFQKIMGHELLTHFLADNCNWSDQIWKGRRTKL